MQAAYLFSLALISGAYHQKQILVSASAKEKYNRTIFTAKSVASSAAGIWTLYTDVMIHANSAIYAYFAEFSFMRDRCF